MSHRKLYRARFGRVRLSPVEEREDGAVRERGMLYWITKTSEGCWGFEFFEREDDAWARLLKEAQGDVRKAEKDLRLAKQRLKKFIERNGGRFESIASKEPTP